VFVSLLAACLMLAAAASSALALDRVTLKSGKVVQGEITKEGDGFVFIDVMIGKLKHQEILTSDQISKIEHDIDAKADSTAATTATPVAPKGGPAPAEPAAPAEGEEEDEAASTDDGATRVCFVSLEDTVGTHINGDALHHSMELVEDEKPDIVVLVINSGGGAVAETMPLSDVIHGEMKKKYRVVGWIQSAISGASMTIFNCEELYMMREGHVGGTVAFIPGGGGGGNKALEGEELERVLKLGELISRRGKYNPLIMRAMQVFGELSADIDENGNVTWYEGTKGKHLVNPDDRILTLNSVDALKFGVSKGTADTKDELMRLMGVKEWKEVGQKADEYQREFRAHVSKFAALSNKLMAEFQLAMSRVGNGSGDEKQRNLYIGKAKQKLEELRAAVKRAPSYEKYSQFNKEWFEEMFEKLRKLSQPED
jgi:membrane-bound ClpP family serine protease